MSARISADKKKAKMNFLESMCAQVAKASGMRTKEHGHEHKDITMGENLLMALRQNDYDFLESVESSNGVVQDKDGQKFIGIHFNHAYKRENQVVGTLQDDFSFTQPSKPRNPIKNISALYDNPLSEKMMGVLFLRKLRGPPASPEVIKSYADKYPDFQEKYDKIQPNADKVVFEEYYLKARKLEREQPEADTDLSDTVLKMQIRAQKADSEILKRFEKRIKLTADQVDLIDNLEKLFSETTDRSPDGTVKLHHLKVNPKSRMQCQLLKLKDESYEITFSPPLTPQQFEKIKKISGVGNLRYVENKIICEQNQLDLLMKEITEDKVRSPFEGLRKYRGPPKSGQQVKAEYTGFYEDEEGKKWMIKKSENYAADNIAEVVTSSLLQDFIDPDHAVAYEFIKSTDGEVYLKSEVRDEFKTIKDLLKDKKRRALRFGSNPVSDRNKEKIDKTVEEEGKETNRQQMAKILAGSLLTGDSDCQVDNICFYTSTKDGKRKMAKFDDGWGLADLCTASHKQVNVFEKIAYRGVRATHGNEKNAANLPTNHYVDYPNTLHSKEFVQALKAVGEKALNSLDNSVKEALLKIDMAFISNPTKHLKAYKDFASHLGLENLANDVASVKNTIQEKLTTQLQSRAKSMLLLSATLDLKINMDKDKNSYDLWKALSNVYELVKQEDLTINDLFLNFQNAPHPFQHEKSPRDFLKKVLECISHASGFNEEEKIYGFFKQLLDATPEPALVNWPPKKEPQTPALTQFIYQQQQLSEPYKMQSRETLLITEDESAMVNEKIEGLAIFTTPDNLPTFTGEQIDEAWNNCGLLKLQQLTYQLEIPLTDSLPRGEAIEEAKDKAKKLLQGRMGKQVAEVIIGTVVYKGKELEDLKKALPDPASVVSSGPPRPV